MRKLFILFFAVVITACSVEDTELCPTYSIENTEEVQDLHSFVQDVDFLPLCDSLPFGMVLKAMFTEDRGLLILDSEEQILLFSNNYTQVCFPILRGRASNEYLSATDIALRGDELIILDGSTIHCHSLSDRNRNYSYQLSLRVPGDAIAPMGNSGVYVFSAYSNNFNDNKKKKDNLLYGVNSRGEVINEYLRREDCTFTLFNISQSNGAYYLRPQNNRNVFYSLEEKGIEPKLKIDFCKSNIPERYYYNVAREDIGKYMNSPYYKLPLDLSKTDKLYYLHTAGPNANDIALLFNIESKRGIRWTNLPADGDMRILTSDSTHFILIYTPDIDDTGDLEHGPLFNILKYYSDSLNLEKGKSYLAKILIDV